MVLDCNLDVRIFCLTLDCLEYFDGLVDVPIDATVAFPVTAAAEITPGNRAAQLLGGTQQQPSMINRRAPLLLVVRIRGRADATCADLQLQPSLFGLQADLLQVRFVETLIHVEIGQEQDIDFERGCIFDQLRSFPIKVSNGEVIESQLELARCGLRLA